MKQVLQYPKRGQLRIEDVPRPALKVGGVVIKNASSLLSAGTERSIIELAEKSLVGKAKERPDLVRQVIQKVKTEGALNTYRKVKSRLESPLPLGYSCAGEVMEVSPEVKELSVGQRVAAAGFGYASHAEMVFVPKNLTVPIPDGVSLEEASFVTLGAIALQGVRQANPTLGETVAVIGLGLLGQLTVQMLSANGCRVIGLDIDDAKLTLAESLGCAVTLNNNISVTHEALAQTGGVGVDRVVVTAAGATPEIMRTAAEICRDRGHITVVGAVNMELDRRPFYNKELSLNLSRSYGPGRYDSAYEEQGQDYPLPYVRWTERRNMSCFLQMIADGKVSVRELITHRFDISDADRGYDLIMGKTAEEFLGVVINYPQTTADTTGSTVALKQRTRETGQMSVVALGAGAFSTGVLYPILQTMKDVRLHRIVATSGMKALNAGRQFGFTMAGTDIAEALADDECTACIIATPHNVHAEQVIAALRSNKDVFVEKPLATTAEELRAVKSTFAETPGKLMVGFNRRFAPAIKKIKTALETLTAPAMYLYRINAGFIPADHPLQNSAIGKGRIIGEVCHFVDTICYLSGARPVSVRCQGVAFGDNKYLTSDNIQIQLSLSDGSVGTIVYTACGGTGLPKEYLEIHCQGASITLDDFKVAEITRNNKKTTLYNGRQDKGHAAELRTFAALEADSAAMQKITDDAFTATEVTLAIVEALRTGETVSIARAE